jgi:hypothetical protein
MPPRGVIPQSSDARRKALSGPRLRIKPRRRPPRPPAPAPSHNRWWNRVTKSIVTSIVTLGAVAGAISTVISLWPSPDADDSAEVTVRIVHGIPLSEYQRRAESADVIALKGYSPPDGDGASEPTPGADPEETTASTATADSYPTEAPASTEPDPTTDSGGGPTDDVLTVDPTESTDPTDGAGSDRARLKSTSDPIEVDPVHDDVNLDEIDQEFQNITNGDTVPSNFIAIGNAIGPNGEPVDPAVAAEQIAKVLADARQVPSATEPEPLGVVVSTDLELTGLRDEKLTLSWSLWQAAGGVRLSGEWLNDNVAYVIKPRSDHTTTTLDVWIPLPREPGSYFVRVDLRSGATRIDSGESERFE